jgi:hypothetical protein
MDNRSGEIYQALSLLIKPDSVVELRIPKAGRFGTVSGYYNDLRKLAQHAAYWSGKAPAVYFTINPVQDALLARSANRYKQYAEHTSNDTHIIERRWLPIDCDALRPAGISSTDEEHAHAFERAKSVQTWLKSRGWPEGILADSGNGGHLLYPITLPNTPDSTELLKRCLAVLSLQFDDEGVVIDQTTCNASRIWKVYGTLVAKGDSIPERPHRYSSLVDAPETIQAVSRKMLEDLAAMLPDPPRAGKGSNGQHNSFDPERWIQEHSLSVVSTGAWQGGRKWVLKSCPWNPEHTDRTSYIVQFANNGPVAAGCLHKSCKGYSWHDLRDTVEPGWRDKRNSSNSTNPKTSPKNQPGGQSKDHSPNLIIIDASELLSKNLPEPRWAVEGILQEGVNILAGRPKLGKSWLALNIAVAVSAGGRALGSIAVEAGDVLYLALEDGERRLQKRLRAVIGNGSTPPGLHIATNWPALDKGGLDALDDWIKAYPHARLVVIDTLKRVRPKERADLSLYGQDYDAIALLTKIAEARRISIMVVHHTRKMVADDPLDTVSGSTGITGAADAVLILKRQRGQREATLFITGRDIDERELALDWRPDLALWSIIGDAQEHQLSKERKEVMALLKKTGHVMTPKEVAEATGRPYNPTKVLMWQMVQDGQLVSNKGKYGLISEDRLPTTDSTNPANPTNRETLEGLNQAATGSYAPSADAQPDDRVSRLSGLAGSAHSEEEPGTKLDQAPHTESKASLPFLIPRHTRQALADLGYSSAEIDQMTPSQAIEIIDSDQVNNSRDISKQAQAKAVELGICPTCGLEGILFSNCTECGDFIKTRR